MRSRCISARGIFPLSLSFATELCAPRRCSRRPTGILSSRPDTFDVGEPSSSGGMRAINNDADGTRKSHVYIHTRRDTRHTTPTHTHTYIYKLYTTAVAYIIRTTHGETRKCVCTQVVRCYRAAAAWCFSSLDLQTHTHTRTHVHTYTELNSRIEFARIARSVRRSGSS